MRRIVLTAALYVAVVFTAGFALGLARTYLIAPLSGPVVAVALEAPIMLAVSWQACGWVLRRRPLRSQSARALMGGLAFVLLIIAEAALAFLLGWSPGQYLAAYVTLGGLLGLASQLVFALIPLLRARLTEGP